jgi:hypothetical protein
MKTLEIKTVKMDGNWVITAIVRYSNNKHVKRIYALNGELIDAIPLKNIGNTNNRIS